MSNDENVSIQWTKPYSPNALKALASVRHYLAQGIYQECEAIMARSKDEFCPVQTGALKGSGFVEPPRIQGDSIMVVMGYGGPAKLYALAQHEISWYNHPVGQWKFLETPTLEAVKGMDVRLVAKYRPLIEASVGAS